MQNPVEPTPRRGMSFPFFVSLLIFGAVMADVYLMPPGFVASAAYRENGYILLGVVVVAFLLWLWVLGAARRRATRYEGPVLTMRGSNGSLQPILATIMLVIAANLAWTQTIPRWFNYLAAEDVTTEQFVIAGDAVPRSRCIRMPARSDAFGDVHLCPPLDVDVTLVPGGVIEVTGASSWFGIEPRWYAAGEEPFVTPELVIGTRQRAAPATAEFAG